MSDDISKNTVTLLLIIAVVLTGILTWRIINAGEATTVKQQLPPSIPTAVGEVHVGIYPPGSVVPPHSKVGGNMHLTINKGG